MNVLFLMADQLAPHFLPAYGHRIVKTPRLDEIAKKSLIFDAHYSNSPLCVPALAHYLRAGGYETVQSGKAHFRSGCGEFDIIG